MNTVLYHVITPDSHDTATSFEGAMEISLKIDQDREDAGLDLLDDDSGLILGRCHCPA